MTRVIVVRHAEAEGNWKRTFQGHTDADVSEKGEKQLALLAVRCRNMACTAIYSSPLCRARKTAEAIHQFHDVPLRLEEGLLEINGGVWEGKPWKELPLLYPEDAHNWNMAPWDFAPEKGEAMTAVYDRIYKTVVEIAKMHPGETVFVVSHGCAIRNLLCHLRFDDIRQLNEIDWCDNTAISIVDFDETWMPHLVMENDASHLSEETSSLANQVWWKRESREKGIF